MSDWSDMKNDETDTTFDLEKSDPNAANETHSVLVTSNKSTNKKKRTPARKLKTVVQNQKWRIPLVNFSKKHESKYSRK